MRQTDASAIQTVPQASISPSNSPEKKQIGVVAQIGLQKSPTKDTPYFVLSSGMRIYDIRALDMADVTTETLPSLVQKYKPDLPQIYIIKAGNPSFRQNSDKIPREIRENPEIILYDSHYNGRGPYIGFRNKAGHLAREFDLDLVLNRDPQKEHLQQREQHLMTGALVYILSNKVIVKPQSIEDIGDFGKHLAKISTQAPYEFRNMGWPGSITLYDDGTGNPYIMTDKDQMSKFYGVFDLMTKFGNSNSISPIWRRAK